MSSTSIFEPIRSFLESKPACQKAMQHLKPGVEIRILIDGQQECALFYDGSSPRLERRPAVHPDVEFNLSTAGIRQLMNHPGDNMAQLGIAVLKEICAGHIKVRVVSSIFNVLRNGYVGIIKEAGPEFIGYLAQHGFENIPKIISLMKSLKK